MNTVLSATGVLATMEPRLFDLDFQLFHDAALMIIAVVALFWPAVLHVYFDMFSGAIQTYVFCMLTMTYISDAMTTE